MSKKKKADYSKDLQFLLFINCIIIVLMLSFFNLYLINNKEKPKQITNTVLGAEKDNVYWEQLVKKHPTYIDAWVEMGQIEKVKEIDPNYFKVN